MQNNCHLPADTCSLDLTPTLYTLIVTGLQMTQAVAIYAAQQERNCATPTTLTADVSRLGLTHIPRILNSCLTF